VEFIPFEIKTEETIVAMRRREFMKTLGVAASSVLFCQTEITHARDRLGEILPQRILGKTKERVTILGAGGFHIGWTTEKDAQETIEAALEGGVRFFDTSQSYGDGESELRYGRYLIPKHRDLVFLMTKSNAKDAATVQKHLDESLKRLKTDYVDLWQIHSLSDPDDVDERIANGVLDVFLRAKETGKAKYIGFTGHRNPAAHLRMLERTAGSDIFDTCQMPVNALDVSQHSFINQVIPGLQKRDIALLAMKTLSDGRFFSIKRRLDRVQWETADPVVPERINIEEALNFVWSLPISVLITGAENADLMREKIELAKKFTAIDSQGRAQIAGRVVDLAKEGKVEYYKRVE
jgi:predicted aldo/keto reductase-like oxidoreductase